jgi:phosphoglycerol transferase MdoB-like AlkP superfamily enzyme
VGDHGFGTHEQLTEIDLYRFHVPLLLIGPQVAETFGGVSNIVGSQVDIVPTIMGRLSGKVQHQCWGRDLLNLPRTDQGFAVIKPSGGDQTLAIIEDDRILIQPKGLPSKLYRYQPSLGVEPELNASADIIEDMSSKLNAYLQTATTSLLSNTTGAFKVMPAAQSYAHSNQFDANGDISKSGARNHGQPYSKPVIVTKF